MAVSASGLGLLLLYAITRAATEFLDPRGSRSWQSFARDCLVVALSAAGAYLVFSPQILSGLEGVHASTPLGAQFTIYDGQYFSRESLPRFYALHLLILTLPELAGLGILAWAALRAFHRDPEGGG